MSDSQLGMILGVAPWLHAVRAAIYTIVMLQVSSVIGLCRYDQEEKQKQKNTTKRRKKGKLFVCLIGSFNETNVFFSEAAGLYH